MTCTQNVREMHDRLRLREALADAIAGAEEARAPDRVLALLRGAYRTLESTQFVDDDMIRWAEAGLGAWRRWLALQAQSTQSTRTLLVVDGDGALAAALSALADDASIGRVRAAASRNAALEALATEPPDAVVFDCDAADLAPTGELLDWLATDLPHLLRLGYASDPDALPARERSLFHAVLAKPPAVAPLVAALARDGRRSSTG